jgi:hypothetical protein
MLNTGTATPRLDLLGPILQEGIPQDVYVSHRVLPTLLVQKKNGAIPSFLLTNDQALNIKHAPKTAFAQVTSSLGQGTYSCEEAGVEETLSYEDYEILGKDFAQEAIARRLMHVVLRARDYALSQAIFSATGETTFADNLVTASNTWSHASGVPLDNVLDAKRNIALQTGAPGNAMLIGYDAYVNLCKNAQIRTAVRNILGYSGDYTWDAATMEIPANVLAKTFGLDEIIVANGMRNTAAEGQTASRSFLFPSTYALVFRKAGTQGDVREVALGRTFVYDLASTFNDLATMGVADSERAMFLEQYPRPDINADVFRAREYVAMSVLLPTAGALIKSI